MGYPQLSATHIYEDNQATFDITHKAVKQRRSKHWAMRAHYTQELQELDVIKIDGKDQLADYFTKNNPPTLHKERTPHFVQYTAKPGENLQDKIQGHENKITNGKSLQHNANNKTYKKQAKYSCRLQRCYLYEWLSVQVLYMFRGLFSDVTEN